MSDRAPLPLLARRKQKRGSCGFFSEVLRQHPYGRMVSSLLPITLLSLSLWGCTTEKDNTYDAGTANMKIMSMFAMRDLECGTTHEITGFLISRADRKSVDLCIDALYLLDCTAWKASDPSPAACKSIGVSLK